MQTMMHRQSPNSATIKRGAVASAGSRLSNASALACSRWLGVMLGVAAAGSFAQPASQRELEGCATITTALERLQCFEMLTRRGAEPAAPVSDPVLPPASTPLPESAPLTPAVESTPPPAVAESASPQPVAESSPLPSRAESPLVPPIAESASLTPVESAWRPSADSSPINDDSAEADILNATVLEVSEGLRGNLYFHLQNGQVWRQIEAHHVPMPANGPFAVRISRGVFGEYRLRVGEKGRLVRIRRVQ